MCTDIVKIIEQHWSGLSKADIDKIVHILENAMTKTQSNIIDSTDTNDWIHLCYI